MTSTPWIIAGITLLAGGTYLLRLAGIKLGMRAALTDRSKALLGDAAIVLLLAVAATSTLYAGEHFAGWARIGGVACALVMAWRKMPLIAIILAAGAVTALLRYCGVA